MINLSFSPSVLTRALSSLDIELTLTLRVNNLSLTAVVVVVITFLHRINYPSSLGMDRKRENKINQHKVEDEKNISVHLVFDMLQIVVQTHRRNKKK